MRYFFILLFLILGSSAIWAKDANWKTYRDTSAGFSLSYPSYLKPSSNFETYYFLPQGWRIAEAQTIGSGKAVFNLPVLEIAHNPHYPYYFTAAVRVGISTDPLALKNCLAERNFTLVSINGSHFQRYAIQQNGMLQYLTGYSYRILHHGKCYALEQFKTGSEANPYTHSAKDTPPEQLAAAYQLTDKIVHSFRFLPQG